jgi:hypothetical protein
MADRDVVHTSSPTPPGTSGTWEPSCCPPEAFTIAAESVRVRQRLFARVEAAAGEKFAIAETLRLYADGLRAELARQRLVVLAQRPHRLTRYRWPRFGTAAVPEHLLRFHDATILQGVTGRVRREVVFVQLRDNRETELEPASQRCQFVFVTHFREKQFRGLQSH